MREFLRFCQEELVFIKLYGLEAGLFGLALGVVTVLVMAWHAVRTWRRPHARPLLAPVLLADACVFLLVALLWSGDSLGIDKQQLDALSHPAAAIGLAWLVLVSIVLLIKSGARKQPPAITTNDSL